MVSIFKIKKHGKLVKTVDNTRIYTLKDKLGRRNTYEVVKGKTRVRAINKIKTKRVCGWNV